MNFELLDGKGTEIGIGIIVWFLGKWFLQNVVGPMLRNWFKVVNKFTMWGMSSNPGTVIIKKGTGEGSVCKENRDKIVGVEKEVKNLKEDASEDRKNNREDHGKIFEKIEDLIKEVAKC